MVQKDWAKGFPFLKPVDLIEVPKWPKGCNFRCADYSKLRGLFYFVSFSFSRVRQGEFSMAVTVSRYSDRSVLEPPDDYHPSPTNIGTYNMAAFLGCRNFRWQIVDCNTRLNEVVVSLGGIQEETPSHVAVNIWKPSSFDLPFNTICDEAIRDVNAKLRHYVFPKLDIFLPTG